MSEVPFPAEVAAFLANERVGFIREREELGSPFDGYTQFAPGYFMRHELVASSEARIQARYAAEWLRLGFITLIGENNEKVTLVSADGSKASAEKVGLDKQRLQEWPPRYYINPRNVHGSSVIIHYQPSKDVTFGRNGNEYVAEFDDKQGLDYYHSYKTWPPSEDNKYGYSKRYLHMDEERIDFDKAITYLARTITQFRKITPE